MKIHRPTVNAIIFSLQSIFGEDRYADKVLEYVFRKNRKLGGRDRKWIAESVYDIVRWWRRLWFVIDEEVSLDEDKLLTILQVWLWSQGISAEALPEDLRQELDLEALTERWEKSKEVRKIRESVPDWLDQLGESELGDNWGKALEKLNEKAPVSLRVNLAKATPENLQTLLKEEGIESEIVSSEGLQLAERANVFRTKAFQEGLFEVQDMSSQRVAHFLSLEPGMRVVDACAGAGGKSLHIASLMQNRGKVIAMDVSEKKLHELKIRARRNGYGCIETRVIESSKTIKRLDKSADRVLLDVPCSGLGVIRRNPDTKWKFNQEERERLLALQQEILANYCRMVKPGGLLVYSTCSFLPSENEEQVQRFLNDNSGWELVEQESIFPGENSGDGFFAAAIKRND